MHLSFTKLNQFWFVCDHYLSLSVHTRVKHLTQYKDTVKGKTKVVFCLDCWSSYQTKSQLENVFYFIYLLRSIKSLFVKTAFILKEGCRSPLPGNSQSQPLERWDPVWLPWLPQEKIKCLKLTESPLTYRNTPTGWICGCFCFLISLCFSSYISSSRKKVSRRERRNF